MDNENLHVTTDTDARDRETLLQEEFNDHVETVLVESWRDLAAYFHDLYLRDSWVFRGQSVSTWGLQPSLERHAQGSLKRTSAKRILLKAFRRRAHYYLNHLPHPDDDLGWLALMQHHGVPTRLLDWTRSPYVALYFAMEAPVPDFCAVWVVNYAVLKVIAFNKAQDSQSDPSNPEAPPTDLLSSDESLAAPSRFRRFFVDDPLRVVAPIEPNMLNERLTIQQGLFLCAGDLELTFEQNLLLTLRYAQTKIEGAAGSKLLVKLVVPCSLRSEILRELRRMNVTSANLFPGLDGFARSLVTELALMSATSSADRLMDGDAIDQI